MRSREEAFATVIRLRRETMAPDVWHFTLTPYTFENNHYDHA